MFPDVLKDLRKREGLSQTELAKKLGVSRSSVCAYEAGTREPSNETLMRMSILFDCSVDHLLTGKSGLVANNKDPYFPEMEGDENDERDAELAALLEDLKTRPDMRMLFKLAHGATPADVKAAVKIIEALRNEE